MNATLLPASLDFNGTEIRIIDRNGYPWVTAANLGLALRYSARGDQIDPSCPIRLIYDRHTDEFSADMTALVDLPTNGGSQKTRIFSPRGCHLVAMFARTEKAKAFRRWVLDVLDRIAPPAIGHQPPLPPPPAPPPVAASLPEEPPFCRECMARVWWEIPQAYKGNHPLNTGPITMGEMNLIARFRESIAVEVETIRADAARMATIRKLLAGEGTPSDTVPEREADEHYCLSHLMSQVIDPYRSGGRWRNGLARPPGGTTPSGRTRKKGRQAAS